MQTGWVGWTILSPCGSLQGFERYSQSLDDQPLDNNFITCVNILNWRTQNHSGLPYQTLQNLLQCICFKYACYMQVKGPLSFLCYSSHTCYRSCIMTFQYLTVSCTYVYTCYKSCTTLQKQVGCFNHRVVALVADTLERQCLLEVCFDVED